MIVITSIFSPTPAVAEFARQRPGEVIVIGDRKSPPQWSHDGVEYLGVAEQEATGFALVAELPWNHYARKNIGYLRAMQRGADMILESDDDNVPYPAWGFPDCEGDFLTLGGVAYLNIYREFTDQHIWPRGLPLDEVLATGEPARSTTRATVGVWQGLADGDPDVDAIYRLTVGSEVHFDRDRPPFVLAPGTVSPFNSQNTAFAGAAFPLLYLPSTVTFRFTDILRGLVAQAVLWAAGLQLGVLTATVFQDRNAHDFMRDFASEIPCYLDGRRVVDLVAAAVIPGESVSANLRHAYGALHGAGIVADLELRLLDAWLADIAEIGCL